MQSELAGIARSFLLKPMKNDKGLKRSAGLVVGMQIGRFWSPTVHGRNRSLAGIAVKNC